MYKYWVGILAVTGVIQLIIGTNLASAETSENIVITQVQAGNVSSSRLIEIYNNGTTPVDITGWCVRYVTTSGNATNRACFTVAAPMQRLFLPPNTYVLIGSAQLNIAADYIMNEGLGTGTVGSVYLVNSLGLAVDKFGWGLTSYAEGTAKPADSGTRVYERIRDELGNYIDTNDNSVDFFNSNLRGIESTPYQIGGLIELVDECLNIDGIQSAVPDGMIEENGVCSNEPVDVCVNIEGLQSILPENMEVDEHNMCYLDVCSNLPGFQNVIPLGYVQQDDTNCSFVLKPIIVTELLPNPDGEDSGNEFIELYNPNDEPVDVTFHSVYVNGDTKKSYSFKSGTVIDGNSHVAFYNNDLSPSFVLTNTVGSVSLVSFDGGVFDVPVYSNAKSGESWALVNDTWQYTAAITAGFVNAIPELSGMGSLGAQLADCGEGRERNPATNRCRNITVTSSLTPCKDGQYRSEETNRCRSIASTVNALKPCEDHQFRNPLTNRCKNIASSDDLADCGEGRERNPTTNRCRNVLGASTIPESAFKVEPIKDSAVAFVGWWALGGVLMFAAGYGVWEWRSEIRNGFRTVASRFSAKR